MQWAYFFPGSRVPMTGWQYPITLWPIKYSKHSRHWLRLDLIDALQSLHHPAWLRDQVAAARLSTARGLGPGGAGLGAASPVRLRGAR